MPHVRIQRLAAGDGEEYAGEHRERADLMLRDQLHRVDGRKRDQHSGLAHDPAHPHDRENREPSQHHRPEDLADRSGAVPLNQEQADQHHQGDRKDGDLGIGRRDVQAFHGAQHRNGGRDRAVGKEQRGPQDAEHSIDALARTRALGVDDQGGQRQYAALPLVVAVQDHGDILHQDHQHERPEDERKDAEDVLRRHLDVGPRETRGHRVQRARTDVAEHHTERSHRQRRNASTRIVLARHGYPRLRRARSTRALFWLAGGLGFEPR